MKNSWVHKNSFLLILGIIFIALNLRASIASVGPIISFIRSDTGISNGLAGLLTTLPLLAFAGISPIAPKLGSKFGLMRMIAIGLITLTIGIFIRSSGPVVALFLGTALLGIGIAICNVLLPAAVKKHFSNKMGIMTGAYTLSMGFSGGIASGISFPITSKMGLGWDMSLMLWAGLSVIGLLLWLPQFFSEKDNPDKPIIVEQSKGYLYQSRIAWEVTLFMGLQALIFYCMLAWLPEIIMHLGYSETTGGWMLSLIQLIGLPTMFLIPILADRFKNQRGIVVFIGLLDFMGFCLLLYGGSFLTVLIGIISVGIGQGAAISLALALIGLRTANAQEASNLSGMVQSIGYLMAAIGPFVMGALFDFYHTWSIPLIICLILTVLMAITGFGAGRDQLVFQENRKDKAV